MKERIKKLGEFPLSIRLWTLRDKDSLFRAKEPDRHIIEITATKPKGGTVIIREFGFDKAKEATQHYNHLASLFGSK